MASRPVHTSTSPALAVTFLVLLTMLARPVHAELEGAASCDPATTFAIIATRNTPAATIDEVAHLLNTEGRIPHPSTEGYLYNRFLDFRDDAFDLEVIARLKSPEKVALYKQLNLEASERAAIDLAQELIQHSRIPTWAENPRLMRRVSQHENKQAFTNKLHEILKDHPSALAIYLAQFDSPAKRTGRDLVEFLIRRRGRVPHTASGLMQRIREHRNDEEFHREMRMAFAERPVLWARFERLLMPPEQEAAVDVIRYMHRYGELPKVGVDENLYARYMRHRDDPVFVEAIRRDPAWKLYLALTQEPTHLEKAARAFIRHVLETGELPKARHAPDVYEGYARFRYHKEFHDLIRYQPRVWEIARPHLVVSAEKIEETTSALITYLLQFKELPKSRTHAALYQRFVELRNYPGFEDAIRKDPEAWALYDAQYLAKERLKKPPPSPATILPTEADLARLYTPIQLNGPDGIALRFADHFKAQGDFPLAGSKLAEQLHRYRANPALLKHLISDKQAWASFRVRYRLEPQVIAWDLIRYYRLNGRLPIGVTDDLFTVEAVQLMRRNPHFLKAIQEDPPTASAFQRKYGGS